MKNLKSYSEKELVAEYDRLSTLIIKTPKMMRRNVCPKATANKQVIADEMNRRTRIELNNYNAKPLKQENSYGNLPQHQQSIPGYPGYR